MIHHILNSINIPRHLGRIILAILQYHFGQELSMIKEDFTMKMDDLILLILIVII